MAKVRITAIRQTVYPDLMAKYENPILHTCSVQEGQQWISINGKCPDGLCPSAWISMREFVKQLAQGKGHFYDNWMQNPMSAMISCNDGFRPFSFYIEAIEESEEQPTKPTTLPISKADERLQKAIDRINSQYGNKAVKVATQVLNTDKPLTKREKLSPCYTTNLRDILVLKC